jgi:arylsulfatase A-like enzyme
MTFLASCLVLSALQAAPAPAAPELPNLVLIVSDDQPHDALGCAGHPVLETPALDSLAETGVRFTHAFTSTPICAAARATLLTGRTERAHGYTFSRPPLASDLCAESLPRLLRDAGYRVGLVGKLGVNLRPEDAALMFEELKRGTLPYAREEGHLTERNAERAVEFLSDDDPRPFCLLLWFQAPHAEDSNAAQYVWPEALDELYADCDLPEPGPTESAEFFESLPPFLREGLNRERFHWRFDSQEKRARMLRGYYRMLSAMDRGVGRVLETLTERGLEESTVVAFTGDNGYFLGERGYAGKWTMHERSIRVPFLVRDPRLSARVGATSEALVSHLDIAPTLLDLAGVEVPAGMQGRSLVPLLRGETDSLREEVFCEHLWEHPGLPRTEGLRTERYKYIRYLDHPEYEELYDLWADPQEARNLAERADQAARLERLRARCDAAALAAEARHEPLRVLLLGDSISVGYTPFVQEALEGRAVVVRPMRGKKVENCQGTTRGVEALDRWLALEPGDWDVIHFNFGLHDLKRVHPVTGRNSDDRKDPHQADPKRYERQLEEITERLAATGAQLVFATTTPVPKGPLSPYREPNDVTRYNRVARRVMKRAGVTVNDLYELVQDQEPSILRSGDVHFDERGSRLLAERVAEAVLAAAGEHPAQQRR